MDVENLNVSFHHIMAAMVAVNGFLFCVKHYYFTLPVIKGKHSDRQIYYIIYYHCNTWWHCIRLSGESRAESFLHASAKILHGPHWSLSYLSSVFQFALPRVFDDCIHTHIYSQMLEHPLCKVLICDREQFGLICLLSGCFGIRKGQRSLHTVSADEG